MKRVPVLAGVLVCAIALFANSAADVSVYTLPGDERCATALRQLSALGIAYTEHTLTDRNNSYRMTDILRSSGKYSGSKVTLPVVVVKGAPYFNIANLDSFTRSIPSLLAGSSPATSQREQESAAPDEFGRAITERHNFYRQKHGAPALRWSEEVRRYAQEWAERLAREDRMYHRSERRYGENIYWMSGGEVGGNAPVDSWYSEISMYNFSQPGFKSGTGHFTQVVWIGSTEVGCGKARSPRGGTYVVCNYSPPGNYLRRFRENVLPASR